MHNQTYTHKIKMRRTSVCLNNYSPLPYFIPRKVSTRIMLKRRAASSSLHSFEMDPGSPCLSRVRKEKMTTCDLNRFFFFEHTLRVCVVD